jgi:hypothetical protein
MSLSNEQENLILETWNKNPNMPPSLKDLVQIICGEEFDGRSDCGKDIKAFLATRNLRAKAAHEPNRKTDSITLNEEYKLYIVNNIATNSSLEIAKTLFANESLTNLHSEARAVNDFVKSLNTKLIYGGKDAANSIPDGDYEPPKTTDKALKKINEYLSYVNGVNALNAQQRKCVDQLIEYLHTYSFVRLMNTYDSQYDRKTCEDAFIRYTYDKPDLTQEEIDQYVELSNHIVQGYKIQRRSETLQKQLEQITSNDAEQMKISMGLVEAIGKASTEYHQCLDRRKKLLESLTQKRSSRLDSQIKESASILNLIQAWKNEEERKQLLKYAELEQQLVGEEVKRLESISELKARLMGFDKNKALYG